ncbi:MAG: D-inositol-3-phosphate glycosyltransferase [Chroococcopsis gigantea SAG 12.99]|jgi:glycogen(starch) synthase|nr:D-inositol-3-phosphate glycosyltransferase [Chroococcopsis gigantea SAG 12.99]
MKSPLKIFYTAGPGDVIGTYKYWVRGEDDPSQVSITYSSQFYDVCRQLNAQGYVVSSSNKKGFYQDEQFTIEHIPIPLQQAGGILYHLGFLWYGLRIIFMAIRFRADVAIISSGTTHWFILSLLPWFGIQVIPSLHCVLWSEYIPITTTQKLFLDWSENLFTKGALCILSISEDIDKNVKAITGRANLPIKNFLPVYREKDFEGIQQPDLNASPKRVLFVGRIEKNKGVFDLLKIATRFLAENRQNVRFDICGDGSQLDLLKEAAIAAKVDSFFVCHGHCNKTTLREMFDRSHLFIIPTQKDFLEGFNKVVVEGVLAGRPIVTSSVCPALYYVSKAASEVPPGDVEAYGSAVEKLCDDPDFYREKQRSCAEYQHNFFALSRSWGETLKSALEDWEKSKRKVNLYSSQGVCGLRDSNQREIPNQATRKIKARIPN